MSQAFIREGDEQSLEDIPPTLPALIRFLTQENNGIRVYEEALRIENGKEVYEMSNGLSYTKGENGRWMIRQ